MYPVIDKKRCIECGVCVDICPYEVFEFDDKNDAIVGKPEECIECGECIRNCANEAIKLFNG